MGAIRKARREFGWVTGIVAVEHDAGTFRFRCFGASKAAAMLEKHIEGRQGR